MRRKTHYLNIRTSFVTIIFSVMLIFVLCSIGLTATLFYIYNQYIKENIGPTNDILFGVNTGILCIMLGLIITPVALAASRKMANPLVEMNKVAEAMAKGDFSVRTGESYQGEIGQLAKTLNKLAAELAESIEMLTVERNMLKQILDSMSDGVLGFDERRSVRFANNAFCRMLETKNYFALGREVYDRIEAAADAAVAGRKTEAEIWTWKEKRILVSGTPIYTDKDDIASIVFLFRDVTEAERLEKTRRNYVANVSHELRSPLTAVKGLIIPLRDGLVQDEEKKKRFYDVIYNEIERLNRLVNDLFELSRLQTRNEDFEMQTVNIRQILYDQQDKFEQVAKEKGIKITVKGGAENLWAIGNIDRISQVLTILIDNALKFAAGDHEIMLSAVSSSDKARVRVQNTGSYISEEEIPHIFERFYKSKKCRDRQGAGLGLSIAEEVVVRMNGKMYVTSDGANETSFYFELAKPTPQ